MAVPELSSGLSPLTYKATIFASLAGRLAHLSGANPPLVADARVLQDTCLDFLSRPKGENGWLCWMAWMRLQADGRQG